MLNDAKPPPKMWRYYLTGTEKDPFEWAEVVLCSTGFFGAVTDYGNYAFAWRSTGERDFRSFVAGIDASYAHEKFQSGRGKVSEVYDDEATLKEVRKAVGEMIKEKEITTQQAREIFADIRDNYERLENREAWTSWAWHSETAKLFGERIYFSLYQEKPEPESWAFCTKILPRLQEVLRAELAAEAAAAPAAPPAPSPQP